MAKDKNPLLSLATLADFDDDFTEDFGKQLQDAVLHCRNFPTSDAARKVVIEIALMPSERDPQDQEIAIKSEVALPKIATKVAKRKARSNKANQLMLDLDSDELL